LKILSVHEIPYEITMFATNEGFPLGTIGTRMLIENGEVFTDIGWLMSSKTSPAGTGKEILLWVEQNCNRKTKKLVIGTHPENEPMKKLAIECGFKETREGRFEKRVHFPK